MKTKCEFCNGTGVAKFFDFRDMDERFPDGAPVDITLSELCDQEGQCPEGCEPDIERME